MTQQFDEDWLVQRARHGDLDAFNSVVEHYQTAVYNVCLRMLAGRETAEDVTQETFLLAYRAIGGFRGGNLRAWLLRIASNACYDEIRRQARRPAQSLDAYPDPPAVYPISQPGWAEPESAALQNELRREIERAISLLPPDQRLAIILCDVQGMRYEEIAEVMRSSTGTVTSRVSRGRAKLRESLRSGREPFASAERQQIVENQSKQWDEA